MGHQNGFCLVTILFRVLTEGLHESLDCLTHGKESNLDSGIVDLSDWLFSGVMRLVALVGNRGELWMVNIWSDGLVIMGF